MANTTRFNIEIPDVGADADTWGLILNNYFSGLESLVTDKRGDTITGNLSVIGAVAANTFSGNGANLNNLNASNLASGTVPDARFPATLPSISGANLTNLNASNLATGTVPDARFPATLPAVSGANLTNLNANNIATGTIPNARTTATSLNTANTIVTRDASGDSSHRVLAASLFSGTTSPVGGATFEVVTSVGRLFDGAIGNAIRDPYGAISVTAPADGTNHRYFSLTRAGAATAGIGITTTNQLALGAGGAVGSVNPQFTISGNGDFASVIPGGTTLFPDFACRAWVLTGDGTAIQRSANISSVSEPGTFRKAFNFSTPPPFSNYVVLTTADTGPDGPENQLFGTVKVRSSTTFEIDYADDATRNNVASVNAAVFF